MNNYNMQENEKVPEYQTWSGYEGLRFVQTLNEEQERAKLA